MEQHLDVDYPKLFELVRTMDDHQEKQPLNSRRNC